MLEVADVKFDHGFFEPMEFVISVKLSNGREGTVTMRRGDNGIFASERFRMMAEIIDQIMREEPDAAAIGVRPALPEAHEWHCSTCLIAVRSTDVETIPMPNRPCLYCGSQNWTAEEP